MSLRCVLGWHGLRSVETRSWREFLTAQAERDGGPWLEKGSAIITCTRTAPGHGARRPGGRRERMVG